MPRKKRPRDPASRHGHNTPWRQCRGIRVYEDWTETNHQLTEILNRTPEFWRYETILSFLLRGSQLRLPGYYEIYIVLHSQKPKVAVKMGWPTFFAESHVRLNLRRFQSCNHAGKLRMFVDAIARGLRRIAKEHELDTTIIGGAIRRIRQDGSAAEVDFAKGENRRFRARLVFKVPPHFRKKVPYSLELEEKSTGRRARIVLFRHPVDYDLVYRCSAIKIGRHSVRFIARSSDQSRRYCRGLPQIQPVSIGELTKYY